MSEELDAAKLGNRNNRSDKERIRTIRKQARAIHDTTMEMEPEDEDGVMTPRPVKGDLDIEADEAPVIVGSVVAIKSEGDEWALDVLGVPFGGHNNGKDSDGEFFSPRTKFHEDKFGLPVACFYHGYDENGRPAGTPQYIGKTVSREQRGDGVWYRVILNKASAYAKRVWEAAKQGLAKASSGSVAHLVRKGKDGEILEWPVAELSIFDTGGKRQPANQYAVALPVMKAIYREAGLSLPADIDPAPEQPEATTQRADRTSAELSVAAKTDLPGTQTVVINTGSGRNGVSEMNENEVKQMVADGIAAAMKAQADATAEAAKRQQEINDAVEAGVAEVKAKAEVAIAAAAAKADAEIAAGRRLNTGSDAPYQAKFKNLAKYDRMEPADMAVMYGVLQAAKRTGRSNGPSEELRKAMAIAIVEAKDENGYFNAAKAQMADDFKGTALKANELNQSTLANYGDEWVGVMYSTQLWRTIVQPTSIVGKIPTSDIPDGVDQVTFPLESAPPTFYLVAQASAQDSNPGRVTPTIITSKMGTANKTLTARKMGAAVNYTGELEEDSMIPWAAELRRSMTNEAQRVLEHVVIDGDTATGANTNINDIAGTPAGNEPFLIFDGFRKLPLVTNTANSRDGGALDVLDFLETVKLLGPDGENAVDQSAVGFIVPTGTHWASLNLAEVKNRDYTLASPTIDSGRLTSMWGYPVFPSAYMHRANQDATYTKKANAAGKIDLDVPANNTKGAILAVRWDQWRIGWKRRMTFEIDRDPLSDSTLIVVTMRLGMVYRDVEASSISFNLGI